MRGSEVNFFVQAAIIRFDKGMILPLVQVVPESNILIVSVTIKAESD